MKYVSRRDFIRRSALGLAGTSLLGPSVANGQMGKESLLVGPIGFQSWTIREALGKDFIGTLKVMAEMGYQNMELCSPPGYSKSGFGFLEKFKAKELKKMINDTGMTCTSCHYGFKELKENGQERMDFATEMGLSQMILSSFGLPKEAKLDDWKKAADELNPVGELGLKNGIQIGFHNHNTEFEKLEGELIYDTLLQRLDAKAVKLQFQVWVIIAGYKAADYFRKYPGRFISAHLYDWSGIGNERVPIGKVVVDYKELLKAARETGVKNTFVEMDFALLKESATYLKTLA